MMTSYHELKELAQTLSKSNLIGDLKNKPDDIFTIIVQGDEMGLKPMQALKMLTIIKGKVAMSADGMAAMVMRSPDCEEFRMLELNDERCTYRCRRKGQSEPTDVSFTMADAKKAGLTGSGMYTKFPQAMIRARCVSKAAKAVFPDLAAGLYDSDTGELTDGKGATLEQQAKDEPSSSEKSGMHRALEIVTGSDAHADPTPTRAPFSGDAPLSPLEQLRAEIEACQSVEELMALVPRIREQSEEMKRAIGPIYTGKRAALSPMEGK